MGDILLQMYDIITQRSGFEGRLHFAEKIGISKNKASEIEDSPELVLKWKKVAEGIIGESIDRYLK